MRIKVLYLLFSLSSLVYAEGFQLNLNPCFDMNKLGLVVKDMEKILNKEFCEKKVDPAKYRLIAKKTSLNFMDQRFLGIAPPPNFKLFVDSVIDSCIPNKNLCVKVERSLFDHCLKQTIPVFLLQFAPWINENCGKLNDEIIQKWPRKREFLLQIIRNAKSL